MVNNNLSTALQRVALTLQGYSKLTYAWKLVALLVALAQLAGCSAWKNESDILQQAEEATRKQDFDRAIELYQQHISIRAKRADRPEWENPNFYLLLIGDLELQRGDGVAALESYQKAEALGVDSGLVSDRYRYLASWYEQKGDLQQAFNVLEEFRDRDDLLFDAMLDRIGRELTEQEKGNTSIPQQPADKASASQSETEPAGESYERARP